MKLGLSLKLEEFKLFPPEIVSPQFGVGTRTSLKPRHILSYQLNVNVCPHLTEDNNCRIYNNRPLSCRAFPLISLGPIGTTIADAKDCKFVEQHEKKHGSFLTHLYPLNENNFKMDIGWSAIYQIVDNIKRKLFKALRRKRDRLMKYNLRNNKWEIV